jgi:hypothetical protein
MKVVTQTDCSNPVAQGPLRLVVGLLPPVLDAVADAVEQL